MGKPHRHRHAKHRIQRRTPPGSLPGSVVVDPKASHPRIQAIAYGPDQVVERTLQNPSQLRELIAHYPVMWVNVEGLGDAETISAVGELFGLHKLALEDVVNVHQRAKVEEYSDHLFIIARMPRDTTPVDTEQLSLFLGHNFVLTFLEDPGDCLNPVRERIRHARGEIRRRGADYLAYTLLDAVVDAYFPLLERLADALDALEEDILARGDKDVIARIHQIKGDLLVVRRAIWPHRDMVNSLGRNAAALVSSETRVYLRDCSDHVVQITDLVETYREINADLRDAYLSIISNRMNDIMRVLTVISTLFIPLTFIVGVYGMNFDTKVSPWNMPELGWYLGYPILLVLMGLLTLFMLAFFRRKKWL